jgi:hypothetical protein
MFGEKYRTQILLAIESLLKRKPKFINLVPERSKELSFHFSNMITKLERNLTITTQPYLEIINESKMKIYNLKNSNKSIHKIVNFIDLKIADSDQFCLLSLPPAVKKSSPKTIRINDKINFLAPISTKSLNQSGGAIFKKLNDSKNNNLILETCQSFEIIKNSIINNDQNIQSTIPLSGMYKTDFSILSIPNIKNKNKKIDAQIQSKLNKVYLSG